MQLYCSHKEHKGPNPLEHTEFQKHKLLKTGYQPFCRTCSNSDARSHYYANQEAKQIYAREYNRVRKEAKAAYAKKWRQENKHKVNEYQMQKYALKLNATPPWYKDEVEEIQALYKQAADLTKTTGIKHEVDHIIPLINELVCGLHCKDNLRVITKKENTSKRNYFLPT